MKKEIKPFSGDFIKHLNYVSYYDILNNGYFVFFDKIKYSEVGKEIRAVLGQKDKYGVDEVALYFQTKYQAFRVPWEYASWYEDPSFDMLFNSNIERDPDSMNPFDYSKSSKEKNITLVIDTVFNEQLRKKYSDIALLEQERIARGENVNGRIPRCNPIIVIGFIKEGVINSICHCNNFSLISDNNNPRSNIIDIDYEIWYFYNHS